MLACEWDVRHQFSFTLTSFPELISLSSLLRKRHFKLSNKSRPTDIDNVTLHYSLFLTYVTNVSKNHYHCAKVKLDI